MLLKVKFDLKDQKMFYVAYERKKHIQINERIER